MSDDKQKMEIAIFRFGVISDLVTGTTLSYGEKEKLLNEKSSRFYNIPYSKQKTIAKSTLRGWIQSYKKGGRRIETLMPKPRRDKGNYRSLDNNLCEELRKIRMANPELTVPMLLQKLKLNKVISMNETLNRTSIYRFFKNENLERENNQAEDRRKFEAEFPNEIWQSDVMHGPRAKVNGINKKTYLHAVIDDHSRYIIHAEFYISEKLEAFKQCLKSAIEKRGLCQKLYVDNGSCYSAINLDQVTACLGIGLKHSRPYTPEGRGKIERWFKNIRESFLPLYDSVMTLEQLNLKLDDWVEKYNNKIHSGIKMTPYDRYRKKLECVRPAPPDLINYFRLIEYRKINKDRTFRINNTFYEGPAVLIDRRVELKYHQSTPEEIEIFFKNASYGMAVPLNKHVNSRIGRDYKDNKSGELFKGDDDEL